MSRTWLACLCVVLTLCVAYAIQLDSTVSGIDPGVFPKGATKLDQSTCDVYKTTPTCYMGCKALTNKLDVQCAKACTKTKASPSSKTLSWSCTTLKKSVVLKNGNLPWPSSNALDSQTCVNLGSKNPRLKPTCYRSCKHMPNSPKLRCLAVCEEGTAAWSCKKLSQPKDLLVWPETFMYDLKTCKSATPKQPRQCQKGCKAVATGKPANCQSTCTQVDDWWTCKKN